MGSTIAYFSTWVRRTASSALFSDRSFRFLCLWLHQDILKYGEHKLECISYSLQLLFTGTRSGWRHAKIGPFSKRDLQNSKRIGVMSWKWIIAWLALFSVCHSWNIKIIGMIVCLSGVCWDGVEDPFFLACFVNFV